MTMLNVIGTSQGIVLAADQSASVDGKKIADVNKIFKVDGTEIAFMIYGNPRGFKTIQRAYAEIRPKCNSYKELYSKFEKYEQTPKGFLEFMLNNYDKEVGDAKASTGVVVAGYDGNVPVLYTTVISTKLKTFKPEGSKNNPNYIKIVSQKDDPTQINILDEDPDNMIHCDTVNDIKYHCYKNNFALSFPVWLHKKDYIVDESIIGMEINEIENLAKGLIQKVINQYNGFGDETIGGEPKAIILRCR